MFFNAEKGIKKEESLMKKINNTSIMVIMLVFFGSGVATADDTEIDQLKYRIEQLTRRIVELEQTKKDRKSSNKPEEKVQSPTPQAVPEELLRTRVQQVIRKEMRERMEEEGVAQKINEYVTLFGLIETEAVFGEDFENNTSSEFNVGTVELGFDAQMTEWVTGHIRAMYEGGEEDDLTIDSASIWLGNFEKYPFLMKAGKFYMPYGNFETNMVQDSLTLEIGEINATGMGACFERGGFTGVFYGYKGMNEIDSSDTIGGFGVKAGYRYEQDEISVDGGIGWVNNIADSGGISDFFDENDLAEIENLVPGISAYLIAGYGPFSFIGEYIEALDPFEDTEIPFDDHGAEPEAWNTEFAYTTHLFGKTTSFAIGYQGTREAVNLGLPERRFIGTASMIIFRGTTLALEYFHDNDYDEKDGGTGNSAGTFTTQLSYEF